MAKLEESTDFLVLCTHRACDLIETALLADVVGEATLVPVDSADYGAAIILAGLVAGLLETRHPNPFEAARVLREESIADIVEEAS